MKELLRRKSVRTGLLLIVLIVVVGIVGINVQSAQRREEYNGHVAAAEKYLSELEYEQAIAQYNLALGIEPNAEEALDGLEGAYLAYARSVADNGDYERAIAILEEGYELTGRESLKMQLLELAEEIYQRIGIAYDIKVIPDGQLENLIRRVINIVEQHGKGGSLEKHLPWLYCVIGENELSREMARRQFETYSGEADMENGFYTYYSEQDGVETKTMANENGLTIYSMETFTEDGSTAERTFEWGEKGKQIRQTYSGKNNGARGAQHFGGVLTDNGSKSYMTDWEYTWEKEYDSLGRLETMTVIRRYHSDGRLSEWFEKIQYTYHENGFTVFHSPEQFEDGRKVYEKESSYDYKITDIFGTYTR